ncbi:MAG: hypothetical protein K2Y23_03165 [Cyanobacteria bacterium]|nr:hypothetical protein [Cyanobacteriota bacterium]
MSRTRVLIAAGVIEGNAHLAQAVYPTGRLTAVQPPRSFHRGARVRF